MDREVSDGSVDMVLPHRVSSPGAVFLCVSGIDDLGYFRSVETTESRLARLEERVFNGQALKITEMSVEIKKLNDRLNLLIVVLAGNFGVSFVKLLAPFLK